MYLGTDCTTSSTKSFPLFYFFLEKMEIFNVFYKLESRLLSCGFHWNGRGFMEPLRGYPDPCNTKGVLIIKDRVETSFQIVVVADDMIKLLNRNQYEEINATEFLSKTEFGVNSSTRDSVFNAVRKMFKNNKQNNLIKETLTTRSSKTPEKEKIKVNDIYKNQFKEFNTFLDSEIGLKGKNKRTGIPAYLVDENLSFTKSNLKGKSLKVEIV